MFDQNQIDFLTKEILENYPSISKDDAIILAGRLMSGMEYMYKVAVVETYQKCFENYLDSKC